jgi:hypothetical protein
MGYGLWIMSDGFYFDRYDYIKGRIPLLGGARGGF